MSPLYLLGVVAPVRATRASMSSQSTERSTGTDARHSIARMRQDGELWGAGAGSAMTNGSRPPFTKHQGRVASAVATVNASDSP